MIIIWSNEARISYNNTIDDLIENWPIEIVLDFEKRTNNLLGHLRNHKKFCPPSRKSNLRKCVIHKNASLIYKINQANIELVTFVDNRTNHKY